MKKDNVDNKKFWLASFLIVAGVGLIFLGVFVPTSLGLILGGSGEMFTLGGAIIGVDAYFTDKIEKIVKNANNPDNKPEN